MKAQYDLQIDFKDTETGHNKLNQAMTEVEQLLDRLADRGLINDHELTYDEGTSDWLNEENNDE